MTPKTTAILLARKLTKERRSHLVPKVYTLKLDLSKISKTTVSNLHLLFKEAKWLYNNILASEDCFKYDTKSDKVTVLDKDRKPQEIELTIISSQMKQEIRNRVKQNILNLSKTKKHGIKVGRLKFRSVVNTINLVQPNVTYSIKGSKLRVQGFKSKFTVNGIEQLINVVEFGEAKLVRNAGNFYFKVLCYENPKTRIKTGKSVGIDFGLRTNLTLVDTDGKTSKISVEVPVSDRLRKLQKGLSKKVKKSQNWYKHKVKFEKEHTKITNKKKDLKNKVIHNLFRDYDQVIIQDENIGGWTKDIWGNRKVQNSSLGGIISGLKKKPETLIVDKWYPSTKTCGSCGKLNDVGEAKVYKCPCGYVKDRDIHGATNILDFGLKAHPIRCVEDVKMLEFEVGRDIGTSVSLNLPLKNKKPSPLVPLGIYGRVAHERSSYQF